MQIGILLFLESLGGGELILILLFVLMFFGSKNIPSLARGLGKGIREVKDAMSGVQSEINKGMYEIEKHTNVIKDEVNKPINEIVNSVEAPTETPVLPTEKPDSSPPSIQPEERSAAR
ncbi:MAG: twin-arginine translocase TatA/TatE family subunit [Bacteroidia bacterium]|jgi:sec-independent protein translocase protein TatA|nr:twin-arginine translocase TatA/TatE family subunit [Bacteroidota bacterium]MBP6512303.1 twin-arginine translocase TatA/TatE family subunit [Bacteroidia bacterium]MBP7245340.1 twin-arginine translocase TatA/TatE family subunit [Bacteroidia bacterium]